MTQKASTTFIFRQAWTFPESVEKRIASFMNNHPNLWLHAPVGISKLGKEPTLDDTKIKMITLDKDPRVGADITCDIFEMKYHPKIREVLKQHGGFDGVISDPVWLTEEKHGTVGMSYPQRRFLSYAIRDVLRPGGWWVFNGLWVGKVKGLYPTNPDTNPAHTPIEICDQQFTSFRNVSLLVYFQKKNERLIV